MGLSFTIAAGPRHRRHSQVRVPQESWPHVTVWDSRLPQAGGWGPRIYIPQDRVSQLYPQPRGYLFIAFCTTYRATWRYSTPPPRGVLEPTHASQSQSHDTTDGQSASLSWNKAPVWSLRPDFYYCLTVTGVLMWGALSDERTGLSQSAVCCQYVQFTFYMLLNVCIYVNICMYNIYKALLSPGSVQQIMSYC
jgi:hypothetical protein